MHENTVDSRKTTNTSNIISSSNRPSIVEQNQLYRSTVPPLTPPTSGAKSGYALYAVHRGAAARGGALPHEGGRQDDGLPPPPVNNPDRVATLQKTEYWNVAEYEDSCRTAFRVAIWTDTPALWCHPFVRYAHPYDLPAFLRHFTEARPPFGRSINLPTCSSESTVEFSEADRTTQQQKWLRL